MSPKIREKAFNNRPTPEIRKLAIQEGMSTLYMDGISKVVRGITTLSEVYKVAKKTEDDEIVAA